MNSLSLCPHCGSPLARIDLLENDPGRGILFEQTVIEEPLEQAALQCMGNANHIFGFIGQRAVEIEYSASHSITVEPPNISRSARIADRIARLIFFTWPKWLPIPKRVQPLIHDHFIHQWLLAERWYVIYDPNAPLMSEEEEARLLADAAADRLYEDGGGIDEVHLWIYDLPDDSYVEEVVDDWPTREDEETEP